MNGILRGIDVAGQAVGGSPHLGRSGTLRSGERAGSALSSRDWSVADPAGWPGLRPALTVGDGWRVDDCRSVWEARSAYLSAVMAGLDPATQPDAPIRHACV